MRQVNEGPEAELFAESETEFFLKVADVQVTFEVDARACDRTDLAPARP